MQRGRKRAAVPERSGWLPKTLKRPWHSILGRLNLWFRHYSNDAKNYCLKDLEFAYNPASGENRGDGASSGMRFGESLVPTRESRACLTQSEGFLGGRFDRVLCASAKGQFVSGYDYTAICGESWDKR